MLHTPISLWESQTVKDIKEILKEIYLMLSNSAFSKFVWPYIFFVEGDHTLH